MIKEAEANAEDDKRQVELINARNQADSLAHDAKKEVEEAGNLISGSDIDNINNAIKAVEDAVKGSDKELITKKVSELMTAIQVIQQAKANASQPKEEPAKSTQSSNLDDDVVDADFTEK
jgi:molecular chaperone DnaK